MTAGEQTDAARLPSMIGPATVSVYIAALSAIALDPEIHGPTLASSPASVAAGRLVPLLTSGLVVDGVVWPQIALLAVVLFTALRWLGAGRLWAAALAAHVGATLLAYVGIGLLWIVDSQLASPVVRAPDYGISVVLTGELGALTATSRRRGVTVAGTSVLAVPAVAAAVITGTVDPFALASAEHALGLRLGALAIRRKSNGKSG